MTKIQLEPGPASSATHRLTQPSTTLNRRYVTRPTNLAIEEAASSASSRIDEKSDTPSRLVNLRVHSADLLAATAAPEPPTSKEPVMRSVVELGNDSENLYSAPQSTESNLKENEDYSMSNQTETQSEITDAPDEQAYVAIDQIIVESNLETTQPEPSTNNPTITTTDTQSYAPAIVDAPLATIDPRDLAMNIAADYASASMSAASSDSTPASESANYVTLDTTSTDSVDAIAQAASDAIASIRNATEPDEIAEQISSLQAFADNIRVNSSMPEMTELSDTIEKFISVAKKSSKVKDATAKKVTLSPKVDRAAAKVTKSSAKVINRVKPVTKSSAFTAKSSTRPIAKPATKTAAKPPLKSVRSSATARPNATRPATRVAASPDQDQALRQALRSVVAMDDEPDTRPAKQTLHRKSNAKRFALAFVCAIVCVGIVTYFVGTSIPDISVRVAAMQTGVEASYPSYIPRDYSLKDISSESGKIVITFTGPNRASFTLTEEKSSWDSTTLLRNYVEPTWKDNYTSTHEQGITIYVSGSNAAWVNGGVLYKINSSGASLTNKQLRNIVTSM